MAEYVEREALLKAMVTSDEIETMFQAGIAAARAIVASAPGTDITSMGWIRVDERLPDDERDGETVLAIVSGKPHENITLCQAIMLAGYFGEEGWLVNEYPEWERPVVTHWMPLPELPKNKERMTVSEWRRKHKRCAWCKHLKLYAVNTRLPRLFCKVFELEE